MSAHLVSKNNSHPTAHVLKDSEKQMIKEYHRNFVTVILSEMRYLGREVTLALVPTGYNFAKKRRMTFDKKVTLAGKRVFEFLPRDKLSLVTVVKEATVGDEKYYLVTSASNDPVIVMGKYCSFDLSVKGIFRPLPEVEQRLSRK